MPGILFFGILFFQILGSAVVPTFGLLLVIRAVFWAASSRLRTTAMSDTRPFPKSELRSAWERSVKQFKAMSPEERVGTLVDAGILTPGGRPTKPYKRHLASFSSRH